MVLFLSTIILSLIFFTISVRPAHAIIVIIPTVLIPIVNIVVWIVGVITAPVVGLSALYFSFKKKSTVKGVLFGILLVLLITLTVAVVIKIMNPNRPIY